MQSRSADISSELITQQRYVRGKLAYQEFHDIQGIDISCESKRNVKERMTALHQGAAYLEKYLTADAAPLPDSERHAYQQIGSHLDPREFVLIDFIERHLTIRHATHALFQMAGTLLPIRTRKGQGANVDNSHTLLSTAEGIFNFFTLGIADHKVADFLSHRQPDIITISLSHFFKEAPELAEWLWVGSHFTYLMRSMHSHPVEFSGTRFSFHFDPEAKEKTYQYERTNGTKFSRTVKFEDEIYQGQQIFLAMALDLMLHLRFVGGEFREYFLNYIADPRVTENAKVKLLQKVMTLLMPPDITTEAKIPNGIPLKMACVSISSATERRLRINNVNQRDERDCPLISTLNDHMLTPESRRQNLRYHLTQGALPYKRQLEYIGLKMEDTTAIELAIIKGDTDALSLFLDVKVPDTTCPYIKYLTTPNQVGILKAVVSRQPDPYALMRDQTALKRYDDENWQLFSILLSHGCNISAMGRHILMQTASDNHKIRQYLLCHAHEFNLSPFQQAVLAITLMANNENEALEKLIMDHVIDINTIVKTGENVLINQVNIFESEKIKLNYKLGFTLLHLAVILSNVEAVTMLIRLGANKYALTDNGKTCLDLVVDIQNEINGEINRNWKNFKEQGVDYGPDYWKQRKEYYTKRSKNAVIKKLLVAHKIPSNKNGVTEEKCSYVHTASVAVITGFDKKGQRVVVLGRKKIQPENDIQRQSLAKLSEFVLPGGLKDIKDEDFLEAAKREAKEETALDLDRLISNGKASCAPLHVFRKLSADEKTLHEIHFYHFELGAHINQLRLYPYDDLAVVNKISVAAIKRDPALPLYQQYFITYQNEHVPLLTSNGLLIERLSGHEVTDQLDAVLALENDGYGMLCTAAAAGDRDRLQYCMEQGNIPLDKAEQLTTPLIEASKNGHHQIVSDLLNRGADIKNYCNKIDNSPLITAINAKQMDVIRVLCDYDPQIISYFELRAANDCNDMAIIKYIMSVVCESLPDKMDISGYDIASGKMREAMACCVEHGLIVEAVKIMPYYMPNSYDERDKLLTLMLKRGYQQLASDFFVTILQKQLGKETGLQVKIDINKDGKIMYHQGNHEPTVELFIENAARVFVGQYGNIPNALIKAIRSVVKFKMTSSAAASSAAGLFSHSVVTHRHPDEEHQSEHQCSIM